MLARKRRVAFDRPIETWVHDAFVRPGLRIAELTPQIAVASTVLPGDFHSDPADRILIATAREFGLQLVTRDRFIIDYGAAGFVTVLPC